MFQCDCSLSTATLLRSTYVLASFHTSRFPRISSTRDGDGQVRTFPFASDPHLRSSTFHARSTRVTSNPPFNFLAIGTEWAGIYFRRALLDTIPDIGTFSQSTYMPSPISPLPFRSSSRHLLPRQIWLTLPCADLDSLAHAVIPLHPKLKPHARMLLHFRFLVPLLTKDEDGLTPLHYYDSAIQLARNAAKELTEEEFEAGIKAARDIQEQ